MTDPSITAEVFLSHSAKDKAGGRPLAERLRQDGLNGWPLPSKPTGEVGFDEWALKPGDSIPAKREHGTFQLGLPKSDFVFTELGILVHPLRPSGRSWNHRPLTPNPTTNWRTRPLKPAEMSHMASSSAGYMWAAAAWSRRLNLVSRCRIAVVSIHEP